MCIYQISKTAFLVAITFCVASYSYYGRVIDERNNPLQGVRITSLNSKQQVITKEDGAFSFSTPIVHFPQNLANKAPIWLNGRSLKVFIAGIPGMVAISTFDLCGRMISRSFKQRLGVGTHDIKLSDISKHHGISIYRISIGNVDYILGAIDLEKTLFTSVNSINITPVKESHTSLIASTISFSDTLLLVKDGYLNKRVLVKNQDELLGDLRLYDTTFALSASNFPKLDGSTTNVPLARIICCKFLNCTYKWREIQSSQANYYWEVAPDSTGNGVYNQIMAISKFSKTPQSYDSLIAGKRELIFVASGPSQRHYEAATAAGLAFDIRPFAVDALLIVVNKDAAVTGITTQNVKDIYTKTITNWNQVGGPNLTIEPFQREETSGSQELMKMLIMKGTPIGPQIPLLQGMMSVFEQLHFNNSSISYTPYYYKEFQMRDSLIRALKIDEVAPDRNTLYQRTYPHCAEVLVVSLTNLSDSSQASKLRDWLLAPQGQKIVNESGYVPIRESDINP